MIPETFDYRGIPCPQQATRLALALWRTNPGQNIRVIADCGEFCHDLDRVCKPYGAVVINCITRADGAHVATIQMPPGRGPRWD